MNDISNKELLEFLKERKQFKDSFWGKNKDKIIFGFIMTFILGIAGLLWNCFNSRWMAFEKLTNDKVVKAILEGIEKDENFEKTRKYKIKEWQQQSCNFCEEYLQKKYILKRR